MMENKCLYCYKKITDKEVATKAGQSSYHERCSRSLFGKNVPPVINFNKNDLLRLAKKIILSHRAITGVQPKLSLGVEKSGNPQVEKLTIMGVMGPIHEYILKPQSERFQSLPEIEDLTMGLAEISKIKTVKHSLIRLESGELAYLTKRIDRLKGKKSHMEDMCQLSEKLTEHKYRGSHEQIAKIIKKHTINPGIEVVNFYEVVLFCFLTGNNDMHLKNFSLLKSSQKGYCLCPAYDLVASELVVEDDMEELALNLNGKKRKLKRKDFETAMLGAGINAKSIENIFNKFSKSIPKWHKYIEISFLNDELKERYHNMIEQKAKQVNLR